MTNFAAMLRQEIARLSRKENRAQIDPTRRSALQHRSEIAQLKRRVTELERSIKIVLRKVSAPATAPASEASETRIRFVAKGLASQRSRLGLSADEFGKLAGVSGQSIYNWERGITHPRAEQLSKLVALRGIGKREANARLEQGKGQKSKPLRRS